MLDGLFKACKQYETASLFDETDPAPEICPV